MEERHCVSKIYYDTEYDNMNRDWKNAYGIDGSNINNFKDLYKALVAKASTEAERKEIINLSP